MADQCPNRNDIQAIFKRLRNIQQNKVCFDCNSKNPTWATVTYGVFICIDCSAVHRGLGVHLTFVRSTQLDTNWTWLQLRQMQLGGNANALSFFRQHNCNTSDAQQKYNSRAAQLYREKLHQMAIQAMRVHGHKLEVADARSSISSQTPLVHLDSSHEPNPSEEKKEIDFFEEHTSIETTPAIVEPEPSMTKLQLSNASIRPKQENVDGGAPNVELALNDENSTAAAAPRKSTIGSRKPVAKKGLGAKKGGLGAQRVKANFEDIEREAQMADELKVKAEETAKKDLEVKVEEEEKQLASMRLAYQDLSIKQQKEEEKMKQSDPKKAQQIERLGMGFQSRTGVSHSALSDMKTIEQEEPVGMRSNSSSAAATRSAFDSDFFDDYNISSGGYSMYKGSNNDVKNFEAFLLESSKERYPVTSKGWTDSEPRRSSPAVTSSSYTDSKESRSVQREAVAPAADTDEARKKFGSAKAISSDQFFQDSRDNDWERKANLTRFEGSSSISSSDYFGDGRGGGSGGGSVNMRGGGVGAGGPAMQTPDLEDVKESVRQGVTKVAGKLSSLANGVMSSIQDRYGY